MSISQGEVDSSEEQVRQALISYQNQHLGALIHVKRQNSVSIRIRVIDRDFAGISRAERHEIVWHFLEALPEDVQSQVSLLIPLTPDETSTSLANLEFENPTPSRL